MLGLIRDPRDLPFVKLSAKMLFGLVPFGLFLFTPWARWWMAPIYFVLLMTMVGPYTLMLHNTSHRRLYSAEHGWMNRIIPWVLGPFVGQTFNTYVAHHIGMHHPENNLADDLSTTLPYRRDSVAGFAHYFFSFLFFSFPTLFRYHWQRGRSKMVRATAVGELSSLALYGVLLWWNPAPTLFVFVAPLVVARFSMMAGNWGQHAFVDLTDPANPYRNSIVCINTPYNHACFNDGYHVGHHVLQTRHWTEMPADFLKNLDRYREHGAAVFSGLDHFGVWWLLMSKQWGRLADAYVDLSGSMTREQVIAHLKTRVQPASSLG